MQRKRKKFSAAFSGISDHPQKMEIRSNSTPQTAPAAEAAPQPGGSLPPPIEAGSRPGPRRGAKRPRPSPVLPPPRPFHRQSRPAASRIAGITNRREQPTGNLRLPSFVPGKLQEGTGVPSWFPPSAERSWIIFRRGVYVAKNTSQSASVKPVRPNGADRFRVRSDCSFIRFGGFAAKARKFLV